MLLFSCLFSSAWARLRRFDPRRLATKLGQTRQPATRGTRTTTVHRHQRLGSRGRHPPSPWQRLGAGRPARQGHRVPDPRGVQHGSAPATETARKATIARKEENCPAASAGFRQRRKRHRKTSDSEAIHISEVVDKIESVLVRGEPGHHKRAVCVDGKPDQEAVESQARGNGHGQWGWLQCIVCVVVMTTMTWKKSLSLFLYFACLQMQQHQLFLWWILHIQ